MDRETWRMLAAILLLCFLFKGTPDMWDKLHAAAMRAADGACHAEVKQ